MTWYKILDEIPEYPEYEVGQEYPSLPDEVLEMYPDSFEEVEDEYKQDIDPFDLKESK